MSLHLRFLRHAAFAFVLLCAAVVPARAQDDYGDNVSYQQFYDELSPYGEWIDDPQNGYVWIPDAGDDFRPYYTNGYWTNTNYGNTWVSNYDWGWAPFHYGRWTYSNYYGWIWIPGNEWGPAWVSWRSGGGAYGWAPLGPGVSINISFGNNYYVPDYWWTFAPQQYILNPRFHQYSYGPRYNNNYIRQTTIINNTYVYNNRTYVTGPRRQELERATGRPVNVVSVRNQSRPNRSQVRGNSLSMYRPVVNQGRSSERPRQFRRAEQPINTPPAQLSTRQLRSNSQAPSIDRSNTLQQDRNMPRGDRSLRNGMDGQPSRIDRAPVENAPVMRRQGLEARPEMPSQRAGRNWNNNNLPDRSESRQPRPQIERPSQPLRQEAAPIQRQMAEQRRAEMPQRPQMEQSQPRIQRPMPEPRQPQMQRAMEQHQNRMQQPRMQQQPQMQRSMEAPRPMQRQAPAAAPVRMERQQNGSGTKPTMR